MISMGTMGYSVVYGCRASPESLTYGFADAGSRYPSPGRTFNFILCSWVRIFRRAINGRHIFLNYRLNFPDFGFLLFNIRDRIVSQMSFSSSNLENRALRRGLSSFRRFSLRIRICSRCSAVRFRFVLSKTEADFRSGVPARAVPAPMNMIIMSGNHHFFISIHLNTLFASGTCRSCAIG